MLLGLVLWLWLDGLWLIELNCIPRPITFLTAQGYTPNQSHTVCLLTESFLSVESYCFELGMHVFIPVIAKLANLSLRFGKFPACYKRAQVLPLLKKVGLDTSLPANYRPISNLSTVFKILERLVLARLRPHLHGSVNFSQYQDGLRCHFVWR